MFSLSFLLALLPLLAKAYPSPASDTNSLSVARRNNPIPISNNTLAFASKVPRSSQRRQNLANYMGALQGWAPGQNGSNVTLESPGGADDYTVNITVGGQNFTVIFDTGSSDLWLYAKNFTCLDPNDTQVPLDECAFGPNPYDPDLSSTFQPLSFQNHFLIGYGGGENISGYGAKETISIGDLVVTSAEFAVAEVGNWDGDGVSDGILGWAYPLIGSIYYGTNLSDSTGNYQQEYLGLFFQAVQEGLVQPYFSVVLDRATLDQQNSNETINDLGSVTLGGMPDIPVTNATVTFPNLNFTGPLDNKTVTGPAFFTGHADRVNFPGSESINTTMPRVIFDSGTTLIYLEDAIAIFINDEFVPPAKYDPDIGYYRVPCDAQAPNVSVTFDGVDFSIDPRDLITSLDLAEGCISSVNSGDLGSGVYILGDKFLVNVVFTANVATNEITLTQRVDTSGN